VDSELLPYNVKTKQANCNTLIRLKQLKLTIIKTLHYALE